MIWIRADANREIGTGHVMRCLSIAAALKKLGQQVCFLTADQGAAALLQAKGQAYRVLDSDYRDLEGELATLERLFDDGDRKGSPAADFFLADSYYVTAAYFRKVREWMPVGCLDDKCLSGFPLDILINYNIFAEASLYGETQAELLLGTEYAPLRKEFINIPYEIRERASRVLVTTGGSDRYGLAGRFVEKALADARTAHLEYCIVSGVYNVHLEELLALEKRYPNVKIRINVSDMQRLMQESDMAVTAGGSTMYELSAVGVPMACFSFVDNQERIVEGFSRRGLVCFGGNYLAQGEAMLDGAVEGIARLAADAGLRAEYSTRLRNLVDGQGAMRIARQILQHIARPIAQPIARPLAGQIGMLQEKDL